MSIDKAKISELASLLKEHDVTVAAQTQVQTMPTIEHTKKEELQETETGTPVKSPMVGTVYLSPSPGAKQFVSPGDRVKAGDVLCLIEAMKMFNKIKAETSGVISKVLVKNEHPVEFGTKLFVISEN
jgi:acetyl-CoA carboxylase biotin carboxyl carrier protein